jgi:hypothetical protein
VIDISPPKGVPAGPGRVPGGDPGKGGVVQRSDRPARMDDDSTPRPENGGARIDTAPVIRLLADPRRVRRA